MTIHLTPINYYFALQAAQMMDGNADTIHVAYESPPNVEIGGEVEVCVGDYPPQIAVVDAIRPAVKPGHYDPRQEAVDRGRDEAIKQKFSQQFGIPTDVLNQADADDDHFENMKAQYWLILRHKGEKPPIAHWA